MISSVALLLLSSGPAAAAGYGVPEGDLPSLAERQVVLWTNAARVAPDAFVDDYSAGGCSTADFSEDELTPKDPLYVDLMLTDAARFHSEDMAENGCFQHESCDGTDTWTRILDFYTDAAGAMGENIAMGGPSARFSVLSMWMCSHDGHRANIMSGDFNEMGAGVSGSYMTQDFAGGELKEGSPPLRMAADDEGVWYADWGDAAAPAELVLVRDGIETTMELTWGEPERGIYAVAEFDEDPEDPCHASWVRWTTAGGEEGTFPETGAFIDGECDGADGSWTETRPSPPGLFDDEVEGGDEDELEEAMKGDISLVGCATAPAGTAPGLLGALAALTLLRRRRARR